MEAFNNVNTNQVISGASINEEVSDSRLISMKTYAQLSGCSYENIRLLVNKKYAKELSGHIIDGKPVLLDEYAVKFLDDKRFTRKAVRMTPLSSQPINTLEKMDLLPKTEVDNDILSNFTRNMSSMSDKMNAFGSSISSLREMSDKSFSEVNESLSSVSSNIENITDKLDSSISSLSEIISRKDEEISSKDKEIAELKQKLYEEQHKSFFQKVFGKNS